jgi:16S rRNA (uracil1498-N3)-methyltransferase
VTGAPPGEHGRVDGREGEAPPRARLHVEAPLAAGAAVALGEGQAHYLRAVLRLGAGAAVALFNGRDGEWQAVIESLGKRSAGLLCRTQTRPQRPEPDLWLLFAPIKRARIDFLVEKATELGVARLQPVITRRTMAARLNPARLRAHAVEAAEQCERLTVPDLAEPLPLARCLAAWPAGRRLLLAAEAGPAEPIAAALAAAAAAPAGAGWAVLVGPEGGFDPGELDDLHKLPFVSAIGLGPRILRAETAALAALACWQAVLGDGRDASPARRRGEERD